MLEQSQRLDAQNSAVAEVTHAQQQLAITLDALALELGYYAQLIHAEKNTQKAGASPPGKTAEEPVAAPAPQAKVSQKTILGRLEWVYVDAVNQVYEAELDTGTLYSFLHVANWEKFERDGKDWVRIELHTDKKNAPKATADQPQNHQGSVIELPVSKWVKARINGDSTRKKPVIATHLTVGPLMEEASLVLSQGKKHKYSVVLGRQFLRDVALVDVAHKHLQPKPSLP